MLHLALAGNLLCAVRGKPRVYGRSRIPQYPSKIFYDKVPMNLKPARKETIKTFVKVNILSLIYINALILHMDADRETGACSF